MAEAVVDGEDEWEAVDDERNATDLVTFEKFQALGLRDLF
jgi:hypothetical protein